MYEVVLGYIKLLTNFVGPKFKQKERGQQNCWPLLAGVSLGYFVVSRGIIPAGRDRRQ